MKQTAGTMMLRWTLPLVGVLGVAGCLRFNDQEPIDAAVASPDGPVSGPLWPAFDAVTPPPGPDTAPSRPEVGPPDRPRDASTVLRRLSVVVMGPGLVTAASEGLSCEGSCTIEVPDGTPVTLTATADPSSTFRGWSGACMGTTCALEMTADRMVTATFHKLLSWERGLPGGRVAVAGDDIYVVGSVVGTQELVGRQITSAGEEDAFIARLDGQGGLVWLKTFGGPAADWITDIHVAPNGEIVVHGATRSGATLDGRSLAPAGSVAPYFVAWLAPSGALLRTIASAEASAFAVDSGAHLVFGDLRTNGWLTKQDLDGRVIWDKTWPPDSFPARVSVVAADARGAAFVLVNLFEPVTIEGRNFALEGGNAVLLKLNAAGAITWAEQMTLYSFPGPAIRIDERGDVYLGFKADQAAFIRGQMVRAATGAATVAVVKLDGASGAVAWTNTLGGVSTSYLDGMTLGGGASGVVISASSTAPLDFAGGRLDTGQWLLRLDPGSGQFAAPVRLSKRPLFMVGHRSGDVVATGSGWIARVAWP